MRIDPRTKIIAGFLLIIALMTLPWGISLWSAVLLFIFAIIAAKPPFNRLFPGIIALSWMIVLTVLIHGFTTPGKLLYEIPMLGWYLTLEGVQNGGIFALRIAAVVVLGITLSISIKPLEGVKAIGSLTKPLSKIGVPVNSLILMMGMSMRFVPIIFEESIQIQKALKARGWNSGSGLIGKIKAWLPLFIPIFASGLRRSDDLADTLILRGFDPAIRPTTTYSGRWGMVDTGIVIAICLPFILLFTT